MTPFRLDPGRGSNRRRLCRHPRHRNSSLYHLRDADAPDDAGCSFHFSDGFCDDSFHFLFDGRVITLKALSCYILGTSEPRPQPVAVGERLHRLRRSVRDDGDDGDDGVDRRGDIGRADSSGGSSSISGESKKQRRDKIAAAAASERASER